MSGWDELIKEVEAQLAEEEAEEQEASAELGEVLELAEHEAVVVRWRGDGTVVTRRGVIDVPLFWDGDGARRFMWPKAKLTQAIDDCRPIDVGAAIAIVRGVDKPNSDPDKHPTQRYAALARPCSDPLPGEETAPAAPADAPSPAAPADDDIPFMPTL